MHSFIPWNWSLVRGPTSHDRWPLPASRCPLADVRCRCPLPMSTARFLLAAGAGEGHTQVRKPVSGRPGGASRTASPGSTQTSPDICGIWRTLRYLAYLACLVYLRDLPDLPYRQTRPSLLCLTVPGTGQHALRMTPAWRVGPRRHRWDRIRLTPKSTGSAAP